MRKHRISKKSIFWNLMLTGVIPALCSVLILCIVFSMVLGKSISAVENSHEQNIAFSVTDKLDDLVRDSEAVCSRISGSDWFYETFISHGLSGRKLSAAEKREAVSELSQLVASYSYIERIGFSYYMAPETLFSNSGVYEDISFFREMYPDRLEYAHFPSREDGFSSVTVNGKKYLIYTKNVSDIAKGSEKACVNVFFDEERVRSLLNAAVNSEAECFRILDESGAVLWETRTGLYDEKKFVTVPASSNISRTRYQIEIPYSVDRKTFREAIPVIVLTLIFDILVCMLLAYYYSRQNYAPIQETIKRYTTGNVTRENEYELLNNIVDQAFTDKDEAQQTLNAIYPMARQRLIRGILDGTAFLQKENADAFTICGIDFTYPYFRVITILTSISDLFSEQSDKNMILQLTTVALEEFTEKAKEGIPLSAYLYLHGPNRFSVIVNYETENAFSLFCQRLYNKCMLSDSSVGKNACTVMGIGNSVFSERALHQSSDQADFALNIHASGRESGIYQYSDAMEKAKVVFSYSHSEERILEQAISTGDSLTASRVIRDIMENNREARTPYSLEYLYFMVSSTVLRAAQENGVNAVIVLAPKVPESREEIEKTLLSGAEEVCGKVRDRMNRTELSADEKMLCYIEEHLFDMDLSLASVADAMNRTQASVSEGFKKLTGRKYIDYVNEKRIQKAEELMETEGMDMNQVYEKVGYVSISTFRRNYQRYGGKK